MPQIPRIGLFIESSRASGRALLQGIARFAHRQTRWSFYWEPGGLEKVWPQLRSLDLSGIILRDVDQLEEVLAMGVPAVVVGHSKTEVTGLVNVVTDSDTIGCMAAEHLIACGFQNFAYCGLENTPLENAPWSKERKMAFCERLKRASQTCHVYPTTSPVPQTWPQERRSMVRWLQALPRPLGLMACNDDRAQQVLEACKLADLPVPDAVGLIGVDNDEVVCGLSDPQLSSVAVNFERSGFEAAQALDSMIRGKRTRAMRIEVPATHVVARRSTDFVAADDKQLARALRCIRDHAPVGRLGVAEVAREAGLSRRALERRFRSEIGTSIQKYIRKVRVGHIARLLVETHLSISQIAESLGFVDVQHFARYFRADKGMSPLAYRKAYATPM